MDADELIENFELFDDWEERYAYLIDLGKKLPPLADAERTPESVVKGCMSQVWFVADPPAGGALQFRGDSDSSIVRGLIAVLRVLFVGKSAPELADLDVHAVFGKLGLEQHLSANRRNGFFAMVTRLRAYAAEL